jgi:alcohol dehydrogenase
MRETQDPVFAGTRAALAPTVGGGFHLPTRVCFGRGSRVTLAEHVGDGPCLVVTSASGRARWLADRELGPVLAELDAVWLDAVDANPTVAALDALVARARSEGWRRGTIVAIGGGSVLDAAKAVAAGLAVENGSVAEIARTPAVLDELDVARLVALPTTSGSGSEVTPVAVVWHRTPGGGPRAGTDDGPAKVSLAHPRLFPTDAIVDPALTDGLPAHQTLATSLDAFNQAAESIWNRSAGALGLPLAMRAMALVWHALPAIQLDRDDRGARDALAEASLLAGVALGQARTVACHALSYPLTDRYGVTHGIACAFTMAAVMQHMVEADDGRLATLAAALLGDDADAEDLPAALAHFLERLGVGAEVRAAVGSREALLALLPEVQLPERGGHGLRDLDAAARERVMRAAWAGEASV